jgi:hypothetical protein
MASNAGFTQPLKDQFTDALKKLYERSPTAANIINAAVGWNGTTATKSFYFIYIAGAGMAYTQPGGSNAVVLDLAFANPAIEAAVDGSRFVPADGFAAAYPSKSLCSGTRVWTHNLIQ